MIPQHHWFVQKLIFSLIANPSNFSLNYICVSIIGLQFSAHKMPYAEKYKVRLKGLVCILPSDKLEFWFANVSILKVIPLLVFPSLLFLRLLSLLPKVPGITLQ